MKSLFFQVFSYLLSRFNKGTSNTVGPEEDSSDTEQVTSATTGVTYTSLPMVVNVDSSGCVSIPASLLQRAGLTQGVVFVQQQTDSLTIKAGGRANLVKLTVYPDGRVRLTRKMVTSIGLNPGDRVLVKGFKNKLVISR